MVTINLSSRSLYSLIAIILVVVLGVVVYANVAGTAPNPGHTTSQISPPAGCQANQVLTWNGTELVCVSSSGGSQLIVARARRTDTTGRPIILEPGLDPAFRSAFIALNNVASLDGSPTNLDGVQCNSTEGWKLVGCWSVVTDEDSDVYPWTNGCVTNDFDQYSGVALTVACAKLA